MKTSTIHYNKPPITEAIFELFSEDAEVIETENLLSHFQETFPSFSEGPKYLEILAFNFDLQNKDLAVIDKQKPQRRCRIETPANEQNNLLIQFDYSMCALNVLKPYKHYEPDYLPLIEKLYKSYIEKTKTRKLKLLGQRYINRIILPGNCKPEDYFTFYPSYAKESILNSPPSFSLQIEYNKFSNGSVVLSLNKDLSQSEDEQVFFLDIYARCEEDLPQIDWNNLREWNDKAHTAIKIGFEEAITDKARDLFKIDRSF